MVQELKGLIPESWCCIDRGTNTAPGFKGRAEMEAAVEALGDTWSNGAGVEQRIGDDSEVYTVRERIWNEAGGPSGCLCIGCLEKRIGRQLRPKDFQKGHPFNVLPGTPRLLKRRG